MAAPQNPGNSAQVMASDGVAAGFWRKPSWQGGWAQVQGQVQVQGQQMQECVGWGQGVGVVSEVSGRTRHRLSRSTSQALAPHPPP